jgi:hypothetical protein
LVLIFNILAETITATRKELAENGIELPKFQKIAGLLSEDIKGNTLTLHEAILEINNSIKSKVQKYYGFVVYIIIFIYLIF